MGLLGKLLSKAQTAARYPVALLPFLASCSARDCDDLRASVILDAALKMKA